MKHLVFGIAYITIGVVLESLLGISKPVVYAFVYTLFGMLYGTTYKYKKETKANEA